MAVYMQRTDPVRLFWRRALLFGLLIITILATSGVWRIYTHEREAAAINQESQIQLKDLIMRKNQLSQDITNLNTDRGREAVLRQQYQMGKRGEGLIIIVNPQTPVAVHATSSPIIEWFKRMFSWW
jgi:cell division protein FtsB